MSACRKLSQLPEPDDGPLLRLYRGYLGETGSEVAAAIFALDAHHRQQTRPQPAAAPAQNAYLTVAQAATMFNIGKRTVYRLVEEGLVPTSNVGRAIRLKPADLQRYFEESGTELS